MIWISFVSWATYASTGTIGWLFEKIWWQWKLVWTNIKDGTVWSNQLANDSVTTAKIANRNVTEAKLSDSLSNKINNPNDLNSVKLTWNQTVTWIKTFNSNLNVWNSSTNYDFCLNWNCINSLSDKQKWDILYVTRSYIYWSNVSSIYWSTQNERLNNLFFEAWKKWVELVWVNLWWTQSTIDAWKNSDL